MISDWNFRFEENRGLIEGYIDKNRKSRASKLSSMSNMRKFLKSYNKPLTDIQKVDIQNYYEELNNNSEYTRSSKKVMFNEVKQFLLNYLNILESQILNSDMEILEKSLNQMRITSILNYLYNSTNFKWRGVHNENPDTNKKVVMTKDEVKKIVDYMKIEDSDYHKYYMFRILAETGMRRGGVVSLNLETKINSHYISIEEDLKERRLRAKEKTSLSGGNYNVYFISKELADLLLTDYLPKRRKFEVEDDLGKPLFVSSHNRRYFVDSLNKIMERALKFLNIDKRISVHTFRKTLNTLRFNMKCPDKTRKILLCHREKDVNFDHYVSDKAKSENFLKMYDEYNPYKFFF